MSEDFRFALGFAAVMMPGILAGTGVAAWLVKRNAWGDYAPIFGNPDNPELLQRRWVERMAVINRRILRAWRIALIACPVLFVAIVVLLAVA
jgi:hypothetical protein